MPCQAQPAPQEQVSTTPALPCVPLLSLHGISLTKLASKARKPVRNTPELVLAPGQPPRDCEKAVCLFPTWTINDLFRVFVALLFLTVVLLLSEKLQRWSSI